MTTKAADDMNEPEKNDKNGEATSQDRAWRHRGLDPEQMTRLAEAEIKAARLGKSGGRHWQLADVHPSQLR